jgi:hypothetical protein|tara:strand:- start:132 stop:1262 length:1131 start_codon:yes stop_codon:yes gene_type:complete
MILNKQDAMYAANVFVDYFSSFGRIDDYLRRVKLERMSNYPSSLPGMGPQDDMFSNFSMHPNDMEFECREVTNEIFVNYLEIVTSHAVEVSVPGKSIKWVVYEKNSGQIAGFIRLGSPTINSKPRNMFLGKPLDTHSAEVMKRFNDSTIMGFIIVPTQPFGFNVLGGKLLAGICCSHLTKNALDKKYGGPFCMFETTSLYGTTKSVSQYDGMKPFLRHKGETVSDFAPLINDANFLKLKSWFEDRNDGQPLVDKEASSRKLKTQTKMISIIKNSLKKVDEDAYNKFCKTFLDAKGLTEQKRAYMSDYGYSNVKEYMNMETDTLIKKDNWDRYSLEGVTEWWRKKASNRFETLKSEGRLRTIAETWNTNPSDIDIIR